MPAMPHAATSKYRYVRELGKGAFGSVILAEDTSAGGQLVAVKKLPRSLVTQECVERELLLHSRLRHPHIVRFQQVFLSPTNINIVMELVPDGSLLTHVQQAKRLSEAQARWLFQQLVFAVDYIHRLGIANRDIKLDNILLDKSDRGRPDWPILKVGDWGYSKSDAMSVATSKVGTLSYMAPEVLHNSGKYDGKTADIWSCGVCLYAMLVGGMPFNAQPKDNQTLAQSVVTLLADMQAERFSLPGRLSSGAQDLVCRLLRPDPAQRASLAEIMTHPWFVVGLPPNSLDMNATYVGLPRGCQQSEAEINLLIAKAREAAAAEAAAGPLLN